MSKELHSKWVLRCCSRLSQGKRMRSYWRKMAYSAAEARRGNWLLSCCWRRRAEDSEPHGQGSPTCWGWRGKVQALGGNAPLVDRNGPWGSEISEESLNLLLERCKNLLVWSTLAQDKQFVCCFFSTDTRWKFELMLFRAELRKLQRISR